MAFVGWAMTTGLLNDRPLQLESPFFYAPLLAAGGVLLGRWANQRLTGWTATAALALGTTAFLAAVVTTGGAGAAPLGYSNANAALAAQLLALCGLVAVTTAGIHRSVALLAGVGAIVTLVASWSRAGLVVSVPLLLAVGLALTGWVRQRWLPPVLGIITLVAGAAGVVVLAVREQWPSAALTAFSSARQELWADAYALWRQRPIVGSGSGAFLDATLLAADPDTDTAHSSVLQIAAETGLVGVCLFALVVGVGFALAVRGRPAQALIASAAWTVLVLHSFIDHLLEFPLLVLTAGIVLGAAGASERAPRDARSSLLGERK